MMTSVPPADPAAPKVSVVIATYNSGPGLDTAIRSLDAQTMSAGDFEVIFVDDGSSDDTAERLAELCAVRPNFSFEVIPNSGWPGRPRNIGTRRARGEYVLYMDHDDDIFPEALARMYAYAAEHDSDVLLGKEVVTGGGTPGWPTWRRNDPCVAELSQAVLHCMTPHKLYRRGLIESAGLSFPEGRVRLEDYDFNAQIYAASDRIAILADYPCYRWIIHGDNSHKITVDVDVYLSSLYHSLLPIEALPAGSNRDQLLVRWYSRVILKRLGPGRRTALRARFETDADELLSHFPESIDALLSPPDRLRSALFRRGAWDALETLRDFHRQIALIMEPARTRWVEGRLTVETSGYLAHRGDEPYPVSTDDSTVRLQLPDLGLGEPLDPALLDVTRSFEKAYVDLSVRGRQSGVEWMVPATGEVQLGAGEDTGRVVFSIAGEVDPASAAMGAGLTEEIWDVNVHFTGLGHERSVRVPATGMPELPALTGGRAAVAYCTNPGNLALDLAEKARSLVGVTGIDLTASTATVDESDHIHLKLGLKDPHLAGHLQLPVTVDLSSQFPAELVGTPHQAIMRTTVRLDQPSYALSVALHDRATPCANLSVSSDGVATLEAPGGSPDGEQVGGLAEPPDRSKQSGSRGGGLTGAVGRAVHRLRGAREQRIEVISSVPQSEQLRVSAAVSEVRWEHGQLVVSGTATMTVADAADPSSGAETSQASLLLSGRHSATLLRLTDAQVTSEPASDGGSSIDFRVRIDPEQVAGHQQSPDIWDLAVCFQGPEAARSAKVDVGRDFTELPALIHDVGVVVYRTNPGHLALDLGGRARSIFGAARVDPTAITTETARAGGHTISIPLPLVATQGKTRITGRVLADATIPGTLLSDGQRAWIEAKIPLPLPRSRFVPEFLQTRSKHRLDLVSEGEDSTPTVVRTIPG